MNNRVVTWLEWISTSLLIIGAFFTSFDIIPANKWFSFAGNLGWMLVGYFWRKWSLVLISAVLVFIYVIGLFQ